MLRPPIETTPQIGNLRSSSLIPLSTDKYLDGLPVNRDLSARLNRLARLEVPPRPPVRNACVVYVCGSIEKLSDLRENELQQGE